MLLQLVTLKAKEPKQPKSKQLSVEKSTKRTLLQDMRDKREAILQSKSKSSAVPTKESSAKRKVCADKEVKEPESESEPEIVVLRKPKKIVYVEESESEEEVRHRRKAVF